jgi:hypothetical protein
MNDLVISLVVFAIIFGGALLGMVVRPLLSETHLHPDSKDVVKNGDGSDRYINGTGTGSSDRVREGSFDQKTNQVKQ